MKGKRLKDMRRKMQIIFQDPSACLNPRRTVRQILMEPFEIHHLDREVNVEERIMELLQLVGLDSYHLSRYPHELSGGQKQRIGIARALALKPELIVCDEAVSALDVSVQAQVLNLLQELKSKLGLTYFFISHNLNVVYQVSDRVGVMYLGKMVEIASYDRLYEKRYHPYTEALLSAIPQVNQEEQQERIHLSGEVSEGLRALPAGGAGASGDRPGPSGGLSPVRRRPGGVRKTLFAMTLSAVTLFTEIQPEYWRLNRFKEV